MQSCNEVYTVMCILSGGRAHLLWVEALEPWRSWQLEKHQQLLTNPGRPSSVLEHALPSSWPKQVPFPKGGDLAAQQILLLSTYVLVMGSSCPHFFQYAKDWQRPQQPAAGRNETF